LVKQAITYLGSLPGAVLWLKNRQRNANSERDVMAVGQHSP